MEQSKALQGLLEAADLVKMIEDISRPGTLDDLSSSSKSGIRITLKNIRQSILSSHDILSAKMISNSQSQLQSMQDAAKKENNAENASLGAPLSSVTPSQRAAMTRKSLRESLEKIIDG